MSLLPILCVVGPAGSGKTTLLERLIPALAADGLRIGVVKRAGSRLVFDSPEKDSARLTVAGAEPSIAIGTNGLIAHGRAVPALLDLASVFASGCDLVLAEGYKHSPHDKMLVLPPGDSSAGLPDVAAVGLLVSDRPGRPAGAVCRDDIPAVAAWVRNWLRRRRRLGKGVVGAILVGGGSRRMGTDKAAMRCRGQPVLPYLAELLGGRLEEVWVVGRAAGSVELPLCVRWHLDLRRGCGPLGGIATALRIAGGGTDFGEGKRRGCTHGARAVLAVACDMPGLSGAVLDLLLECRRPARPASVLRNPATGRLEPLAAVYEPHVLGKIEQALDSGACSATDLLESIEAHVIEPPAEMAGQLANVNTPQELREIEGRRLPAGR